MKSPVSRSQIFQNENLYLICIVYHVYKTDRPVEKNSSICFFSGPALVPPPKAVCRFGVSVHLPGISRVRTQNWISTSFMFHATNMPEYRICYHKSWIPPKKTWNLDEEFPASTIEELCPCYFFRGIEVLFHKVLAADSKEILRQIWQYTVGVFYSL